jgi:plastocyanin
MPTAVTRIHLALACLAFSAWAAAASLQVSVVDQHGQPLPDAVVTLRGASDPGVPAPARAVMDQRQQEFMPHVLAVRAGTSISFPNSDNIRHQVYSFSAPKRFELRLYEGTPGAPLLFDKPGVVVLGCNIHDWMLGYIYVSDDPWFAVSDAKGQLSLDGLPAGHYRMSLWHPRGEGLLNQPGGEFDVASNGGQQTASIKIQPPAADAATAPAPSVFGDAFGKALRESEK